METNRTVNYLQLNVRGKFAREEQLLADYFGEGNYTPFYKKHFLQHRFSLNADDFIAGEIPVMLMAMRSLGIEYSHDDYPIPLRGFLHRRIWNSTLGSIQSKVFNGYMEKPIFIKPADKLKKFTGFILNGTDDWFMANGAGANTAITCSDPVKWITEYRIPVVKGQVLDMCHYDGDPCVKPDTVTVAEMVAAWNNSPRAYCLDVGVLDTGETALIEVNDAFSCGSYSMTKETYAVLLTTRWEELRSNISITTQTGTL